MKLPHVYKGFTISARKSKASGDPVLDVKEQLNLNPPYQFRTIKTYIPPLKVLYLGYEEPPYAYDHDIKELEEFIDDYLHKNRNRNRNNEDEECHICAVGGCCSTHSTGI